MTDDNVRLDIPTARGTVELKGANGIFYTVLVDGEPVKRRKGFWAVPLRKGGTGELRARGFIPGFATFHLDGERIYGMGDAVPMVLRVIMFAPLVLIVFGWFGLPLALLLFFMSIGIVKNRDMPVAVRAALPLLNTAAVAVILALLLGRVL